MKPLLFCLLTAAIGNCLYHLGLKSADIQGNPMRALSLYYASAFILSLAAAPFFGPLKLSDGLVSAAADWRIWLVAAGMVLIELGFFLAYRSGGSPQWSGVAVNGTAALLLVPLGILLFHEQFSVQKVLGIVLTLSGIYFLASK
ncbi:hypothetical protein [Neisseria elongata]|jgi:hypothetical protein|uniref:hypothetical protein n=1 Tax=Neisseria elongata TaxID=495 RepID=UPI00066533E9|nr:hypothetical protein [Neisseria elongata]